MGNMVVESDTKIILLQQKLDNHIDDFDKHRAEIDTRFNLLMSSQELNTASIDKLTLSTTELTESTRDIVAAWQAANGTVKTMSAVGGFVKWMSGFAVVGAMIHWLSERF